jgi:hypothetical protein
MPSIARSLRMNGNLPVWHRGMGDIAVSYSGELSATILLYPNDDASDQKYAGKHRADEIEIVSGTVGQSPAHTGENLEPFGDVSQEHDHQERDAS